MGSGENVGGDCAVLLELGSNRPCQSVPGSHDVLKLVKCDRALSPVSFLQPARQREEIQEVRHLGRRRQFHPDAGRRRLQVRSEGRNNSGEPSLERPLELLAISSLDALGHVAGRQHAKEIHVDRYEAVSVGYRQRGLEQGCLAVAARSLEPAVACLCYAISQQNELCSAAGKGLGGLERILVDKGAAHWVPYYSTIWCRN